MEIGLIDADLMDNGTRHPNLALMKIAGYHKSIGNNVTLIYNSYNEIDLYDKVFVSSVFNYTVVPEWVKSSERVIFGGTGFYEDGGTPLPDYIEHCMPYYDLYNEYIKYNVKKGRDISFFSDYINYSIGFTTRGCFRKCDFCVNKKYDRVEKHSNVEEFVDNNRPMIYLWDDNILAYSKWEQVIDELDATGKPFQFRQGLDIRLMTDKKAYKLNKVKYHGDFIFAFDDIHDKEVIVDKIQLWKKYTNKNPKMYVLAAFNSQDAEDVADVFERVSILMKYGCLPYIMRYDKYKYSKYKGIYTQIARWCNQPQFYKKMSFREYCERNQYYHSNPNTFCASYDAMLKFEQDYPEIAQKYYDLRFENENIYTNSYGYGRKYFNKPGCSQCREMNKCWDEMTSNKLNKSRLITLYYLGEMDINCLNYKNSECVISSEDASKLLSALIIDTPEEIIFEIVKNNDNNEIINKNTCVIPKHSSDYYIDFLLTMFRGNINNVYKIKDLLINYNLSAPNDKKVFIDILRILTLMDFISLSKNNINGNVKLSPLGKEFINLHKKSQAIIFNKNIYRLPLMQLYFRCDKSTFKKELTKLGIRNIRDIYESIANLINDKTKEIGMII